MDVVAVIHTIRGLAPSMRLAHPAARVAVADVDDVAIIVELVDLLLEAPPSGDDAVVFQPLLAALPAALHLDRHDAPSKWSAAARHALIHRRLGDPDAAYVAASAARHASADPAPWSSIATDAAYIAWCAATPVSTPWQRVDNDVVIDISVFTSSPRRHRISWVLQLDEAYGSPRSPGDDESIDVPERDVTVGVEILPRFVAALTRVFEEAGP